MTVSSYFYSAFTFSLAAPPFFSVISFSFLTCSSITLYFGGGGKSFVSIFTGGVGGGGASACLASATAASFSVVTAFSSSLRLDSLASATILTLSAFAAASFDFSSASFTIFSACSIVSFMVFGGAGGGGGFFGSGLVCTGGGTGAGGSYAGIIGFFGLLTGAGLGYGFGGAGSGSSAVDSFKGAPVVSFIGVEIFFSGVVSLVEGIGRAPS